MSKKTIWFDINNVPHVNFLLPIIEHYKDDFDHIFSVRDFAETRSLFEQRIGAPYLPIGDHKGGSKAKKVIGMLQRTAELHKQLPPFDIKISVGGTCSNAVAKLRGKKAISFDDNDKSANWIYAPFTDLAFFPRAIDPEVLHRQGFKDKALYQYDGYKEDFYLAGYEPDRDFIKSLPFDNYVVVRAENINASYVSGRQTIVPELLRRLSQDGINVLFLPRYESDRKYAEQMDNVYMPSSAINGLDACYFSDAVLTGAGTMAREAACLGVPAVSFYAGAELLAVDKSLVDAGKMYFSREVDSILSYLQAAPRSTQDLERCKAVRDEIFAKLDSFILQ